MGDEEQGSPEWTVQAFVTTKCSREGAMANCTNCGASIENSELKFCGFCGSELNVIGEAMGSRILSNTERLLVELRKTGSASFTVDGLQSTFSTGKIINEHEFTLLFAVGEKSVFGRTNWQGYVDMIAVEPQGQYALDLDHVKREVFESNTVHVGGLVVCPETNAKCHFTRLGEDYVGPGYKHLRSRVASLSFNVRPDRSRIEPSINNWVMHCPSCTARSLLFSHEIAQEKHPQAVRMDRLKEEVLPTLLDEGKMCEPLTSAGSREAWGDWLLGWFDYLPR